MRMRKRKYLVVCVLTGAMVLAVFATARTQGYYADARAGAEYCNSTVVTVWCSNIGNDCGTRPKPQCSGSCTSCMNTTSYLEKIVGTDTVVTDGTVDCGNEMTNATCKWHLLGGICLCLDGTDSGSTGNCGTRTKYKLKS